MRYVNLVFLATVLLIATATIGPALWITDQRPYAALALAFLAGLVWLEIRRLHGRR